MGTRCLPGMMKTNLCTLYHVTVWITNTLTYIVSTNAKTSPSAAEDGEVPLFKVLPWVRVRFTFFNRFSDFPFWADNYERLLVGICGGRENREKLTG